MRNTSLKSVYQLALQDPRVVYIGSDLGAGVLDEMKQNIPDRFYMEGVSEQHIVGMSAGMAMEGYIPYVNTIATFLTRRCFEQVAVDLCLHDLPVRLIANGGGIVYAPLGPTHLAVEDIAILRALPNMTIIAPCDAEEMKRLMPLTLDWPHPIYIRLAKGGDKVISKAELGFEIGKAIVMKEGKDGLFITTGVMTQLALEAVQQLETEGLNCGVIHMHTVKPLDGEILKKWIPKVSAIVTVEEHTRIGGLGSAVLEFCNDEIPNETGKIRRIGLPDRFSERYGSQESLLNYFGINKDSLVKTMKDTIRIRK
ncbi:MULTISPECIES: transketolase family protein [Leptospira]|uniref:transketolase family protein n=1 Tax=Leptospira TaxID=171 RepID=UPI000288EC1B|nr:MULTISPECIES: transketolase C-terminal domain-containing protein [Leptospira]EMK19586.1 transketolase, C-terminal domain protein [Leptospira kirschneri serovar Bim str. PUO 1247]EMO81418.1 transketolase, C-terminal domain protein [Leptospira kirschneri str. 200801774]EPG51359.1 transketolase, C-terminal domain protein [Leptospira kirschneri serovar Cynopteri str. 3522 CT]KON76374.1 Transketolase, C-terminal domain protein [Leptospira kirschneri serovar Mozdok]KPZ76906.1 transketolase [Lepto